MPRPPATDSPFLIPGRWYAEHPFELLEAELDRRKIHIPVDHHRAVMVAVLQADDEWATGGKP